MTAVEKFKVGDRWATNTGDDILTIVAVAEDDFITYHSSGTDMCHTCRHTPSDWRGYGYTLLPDPEPDRLTALEEQVAALTARLDALERPGETKPAPEPDVPRDCTGREWKPEAGWVVRYEPLGDVWLYVGDSCGHEEWMCIAEGLHTQPKTGQRRHGLHKPSYRILWPLAERSELRDE